MVRERASQSFQLTPLCKRIPDAPAITIFPLDCGVSNNPEPEGWDSHELASEQPSSLLIDVCRFGELLPHPIQSSGQQADHSCPKKCIKRASAR